MYCPIVRYSVKTSNTAPAQAGNPNSRDSKLFKINADETLGVFPFYSGIYTYYILAESEFGNYAYQEYNLTVYPCDPTVATVVSPVVSNF